LGGERDDGASDHRSPGDARETVDHTRDTRCGAHRCAWEVCCS
jgi:hypothetical protein